MLVQQRMTPMPSMDPAQARMMTTVMPIMMTVLFYQFPSGLVLYWIVNTVLSVVQQYYIHRESNKSKDDAPASNVAVRAIAHEVDASDAESEASFSSDVTPVTSDTPSESDLSDSDSGRPTPIASVCVLQLPVRSHGTSSLPESTLCGTASEPIDAYDLDSLILGVEHDAAIDWLTSSSTAAWEEADDTDTLTITELPSMDSASIAAGQYLTNTERPLGEELGGTHGPPPPCVAHAPPTDLAKPMQCQGWSVASRIMGAATSRSHSARSRLPRIGGRGRHNLNGLAKLGHEVVALSDVDAERAKESFAQFPKAKHFVDYRKMLDAVENEIDAVAVSTPDHTHAVIAAEAMKRKKHVYVETPLAHDIRETRKLARLAGETGVATQMGNQHHNGKTYRTLVQILREGAIGKIREAHAWSNRPIWPQGIDRPADFETFPHALERLGRELHHDREDVTERRRVAQAHVGDLFFEPLNSFVALGHRCRHSSPFVWSSTDVAPSWCLTRLSSWPRQLGRAEGGVTAITLVPSTSSPL